MLRNFPIDAFSRVDDKPPRWPTIGIKLSSLQTKYPADRSATSAFEVATGCLHTMMNEWDAYSVDASTAARTIFVANAGLTATDFNLTPAQQDELFLNGVTAATEFVMQMADNGHVPRSSREATQFLQGAGSSS
jgi:NTE family protein